MNKGDVGMAKLFAKSTETRDELSTTCNQKVMSRCLSTPDYPDYKTNANLVSIVRIHVFSIMHSTGILAYD